jgi:beta-carotene 15,15'-dioxygenase
MYIQKIRKSIAYYLQLDDNPIISFSILVIGLALVFFQQFINPIPIRSQFIMFCLGILILGIPHGAADLLVATNNKEKRNKVFSKIKFLSVYLFRLVLFALVLYFFPLIGNITFIFFAAFHFGETDLHKFKTDTLLGKLLVVCYGLIILSVILLTHFKEVILLMLEYESGKKYLNFINAIDTHHNLIIFSIFAIFFTALFLYIQRFKIEKNLITIVFLKLILILYIVYNLPMLLGFTFYFVVWHSILSIYRIVGYLKQKSINTTTIIAKQISLYSILAVFGLGIFGYTTFIFFNISSIVVYIFLGLAVLTAPHMQVMHEMYISLRTKPSNIN